jgi:sporulation protein YlmC with PRC-barrel domain
VAEGVPFTIGVPARCRDGVCGTVTQVVVDPITAEVTHLIVEPEHREGLGRLVPIAKAQAGADEIAIDYTADEFENLQRAEKTRFLPGSEGIFGYTSQEALLWPYFGGNITVPVTEDTLPAGEIAVRRGEEVHATDGLVGEVEGLIVDRSRHHVTHVLLKEGHPFGRKDVAIPVAAVKEVDEAGVRLALSKSEIADLPAVDFSR